MRTLFLALALMQAPAIPDVHLPNPPTPPPPPPPTPGQVVTLKPGYQYVVTSTDDVAVLTSPTGVLSITNESGPIRISGLFSDGKGVRETRTYTDKRVYILEPSGTGTAELLIVRSLADRTKDLRQTIAIGDAPPTPPPAPNDPLVATLQAAFASDKVPTGVAASLAKVYRTVASTTANDPKVVTYQDLFNAVGSMQDPVFPARPTYPASHVAIANALLSALGTSGTAPIDRALTAKTFNAIASALDGVQK